VMFGGYVISTVHLKNPGEYTRSSRRNLPSIVLIRVASVVVLGTGPRRLAGLSYDNSYQHDEEEPDTFAQP
jgi:hypothetical protein